MNDSIQFDPVSGVLNRDAGLRAAARLVTEAAVEGGALAAVWLDIDRFRQVNESFGHAGGDIVIAMIAHRLWTTIEVPHEISRMGSDEFVCLVPGVDKEDAARLARSLLHAVEEPLEMDSILLHPSASIGVALHSGDEDALALLERSDRAMIEAKRQGGNRIVISGEEAVPGRLGVLLAREELVIESDLHAALETGGLSLHYQPIVGFDGRIEAVEALMRCNLGDRQISPGKFIPVAEKTGLIVRLGEWSLVQGAQYAVRLRESGAPAKVAVNVSRAQLISPMFLQALHGALICADIAPEFVELELTESLFMDLSKTVQNNLSGAREAGVKLAIDDFGTGFSCLSSLKDLPATKLKLDRAFVSVLPDDKRALAVVRATAMLARDLGMTFVAEGVETKDQLDALEEAGVDAIQGYFHSPPLSEDNLMAWLMRRESQ